MTSKRQQTGDKWVLDWLIKRREKLYKIMHRGRIKYDPLIIYGKIAILKEAIREARRHQGKYGGLTSKIKGV